MASVSLTRRAFRDLQEIERCSGDRWGKRVAEDYLIDIEQGLNRLRENPQLLRCSRSGISSAFSLYRVREHFLVCTLSADCVYVLAIKDGSMDLPTRLAELEPQLLLEAKQLRRMLEKRVSQR
jgi:plasmid stabilization system protein ParE